MAYQKKDLEILIQIGLNAMPMAYELCITTIERKSGFRYGAIDNDRQNYYREALNEGALVEAFASVLFRSRGRRSLAEPFKPAFPPLESILVNINMTVGIFYSSMPTAYYETFKKISRPARHI
jgi:hypothetical protein